MLETAINYLQNKYNTSRHLLKTSLHCCVKQKLKKCICSTNSSVNILWSYFKNWTPRFFETQCMWTCCLSVSHVGVGNGSLIVAGRRFSLRHTAITGVWAWSSPISCWFAQKPWSRIRYRPMIRLCWSKRGDRENSPSRGKHIRLYWTVARRSHGLRLGWEYDLF